MTCPNLPFMFCIPTICKCTFMNILITMFFSYRLNVTIFSHNNVFETSVHSVSGTQIVLHKNCLLLVFPSRKYPCSAPFLNIYSVVLQIVFGAFCCVCLLQSVVYIKYVKFGYIYIYHEYGQMYVTLGHLLSHL